MIESQYTDVLRKNRKFIEKYDHHDKISHYEGVKHHPLEQTTTPDVYQPSKEPWPIYDARFYRALRATLAKEFPKKRV